MVEKIQNIGVSLPVQNIAPAKEPEKHDNKESNDFVKKHATELAIGAVAVAAAVIGGIIYARKGKGDDVIKDLTKNNDLLPEVKGKSKTEPVKGPNVEQPETATTGGVPESKPTGSTNSNTNNKANTEPDASQVESRPAGESNSATKLMGRAPNEAEKALIDAAPSKDEITAKLAQVQKQLDNYPFMKGKPMTFAEAGGKPGDFIVEIKNDKEQLVKEIYEDGEIYHYDPESGRLLYKESFENGARDSISDYTTNEKILLQNGQIDFVNKCKSNDGISLSDELYSFSQSTNYYTKYEGKIGTQYGFDENWTNTFITQTDADGKKLLDFYIHPDGSIK